MHLVYIVLIISAIFGRKSSPFSRTLPNCKLSVPRYGDEHRVWQRVVAGIEAYMRPCDLGGFNKKNSLQNFFTFLV